MLDPPVDPSVSRRFSRTRGRDTQPELAIRRRVHALGLRYRVNAMPMPGVRRTADLLFPKERIAVLIDGCFFHGCPDHYIAPRTRAEFWEQKIQGNRRRDEETTSLFESAGWQVLRFWEHEPPEQVVSAISTAVSLARARAKDVHESLGRTAARRALCDGPSDTGSHIQDFPSGKGLES